MIPDPSIVPPLGSCRLEQTQQRSRHTPGVRRFPTSCSVLSYPDAITRRGVRGFRVDWGGFQGTSQRPMKHVRASTFISNATRPRPLVSLPRAIHYGCRGSSYTSVRLRIRVQGHPVAFPGRTMVRRRIAEGALAIVFVVFSAAPILANECMRTGDSVSPPGNGIDQSIDPGFVRHVEDRSNDRQGIRRRHRRPVERCRVLRPCGVGCGPRLSQLGLAAIDTSTDGGPWAYWPIAASLTWFLSPDTLRSTCSTPGSSLDPGVLRVNAV